MMRIVGWKSSLTLLSARAGSTLVSGQTFTLTLFVLAGYSDNKIEGVVQRSLLYITESALNAPSYNTSRGMVMAQLLRFMGTYSLGAHASNNSWLQAIEKNIYVLTHLRTFNR